jgi:hypothetical protein
MPDSEVKRQRTCLYAEQQQDSGPEQQQQQQQHTPTEQELGTLLAAIQQLRRNRIGDPAAVAPAATSLLDPSLRMAFPKFAEMLAKASCDDIELGRLEMLVCTALAMKCGAVEEREGHIEAGRHIFADLIEKKQR